MTVPVTTTAAQLSLSDLDDLVVASEIAARRAHEALVRAIRLRRSAGGTWQDVGRCLGISKQLAHKRYAAAVAEQIREEREQVAPAALTGVLQPPAVYTTLVNGHPSPTQVTAMYQRRR